MISDIQQDASVRMAKSVESLQKAFTKIRTGRAHPSLLDQISVPYYGSETPLAQVANVSVEDSRTLKVSPWEKDMIKAIEKAIMSSDLGLNPTTQGVTIRIPLPPLTEERRRDLVKVVKNEAEQGRVAVRNIRRDANSEIKEALKEKMVSKDEAHAGEEKIQKITDDSIKQVEILFGEKEKDLLAV